MIRRTGRRCAKEQTLAKNCPGRQRGSPRYAGHCPALPTDRARSPTPLPRGVTSPLEPRNCPLADNTVSPCGKRGVMMSSRNRRNSLSVMVLPSALARPKNSSVRPNTRALERFRQPDEASTSPIVWWTSSLGGSSRATVVPVNSRTKRQTNRVQFSFLAIRVPSSVRVLCECASPTSFSFQPKLRRGPN